MLLMNLNVSLGWKGSIFGVKIFSSISFRSRMSFTRHRSRLICEMIIYRKLLAWALMLSLSRRSRNISVEVSGVRNS